MVTIIRFVSNKFLQNQVFLNVFRKDYKHSTYSDIFAKLPEISGKTDDLSLEVLEVKLHYRFIFIV